MLSLYRYLVHGWALTNEADTHDIGRANVGVAELLETGHQAGQASPHIRRTRRADHLNIINKKISFKFFYGGQENVDNAFANADHLSIFESCLDFCVADPDRIFFLISDPGSRNQKRRRKSLL